MDSRKNASRSMPAIALGASGAFLVLFARSAPDLAGIFWVGAVALMTTAAVVAFRSGRTQGARRTAVILTAGATAFALGFAATLIVATDGDKNAIPESYDLSTSNAARVPTVAVNQPQVIEVDDEYKEDAALRMKDAADALATVSDIDGRLKTELVDAVQRSDYQTMSGLDLAFDDAETYAQGSNLYVAVPLSGGNFSEVSRTVFAISGSKVSVTESFATFLDSATVELRIWVDGAEQAHSILHDSSLEDSANISPAGFSITKFNRCLLNAGIPQWVIVVAGAGCSAVCGLTAGTACPACWIAVAGFGAGAITACFYSSFT